MLIRLKDGSPHGVLINPLQVYAVRAYDGANTKSLVHLSPLGGDDMWGTVTVDHTVEELEVMFRDHLIHGVAGLLSFLQTRFGKF
jgi:hypothetical protein